MLGKPLLSVFAVLCSCTLIAAVLSLRDEWVYTNSRLTNDRFTANELAVKLEYLNDIKFKQRFFYSQNEALEGELLMRIGMLSGGVDTEVLDRSVQAFRSSIPGNSVDAALWGKLAMSKAMLKQFDSEFDNALRKTFEYGGWEAESNETIIRIGLANVQMMSVESLLIVKESVRRLYGVRPRSLNDLARKMNQLHLTCIWVRDTVSTDQLCQKELQ